MIQLGSVLVRVSRVGLADADVAVTAAVSISTASGHQAQMIDRRQGVTATHPFAQARNHRRRSPGQLVGVSCGGFGRWPALLGRQKRYLADI